MKLALLWSSYKATVCYIAPSSGSTCIEEYSWANVHNYMLVRQGCTCCSCGIKQDDCCQKVAPCDFNADSQLSCGIRCSMWMTPLVPCSLASGLTSAWCLFSVQKKRSWNQAFKPLEWFSFLVIITPFLFLRSHCFFCRTFFKCSSCLGQMLCSVACSGEDWFFCRAQWILLFPPHHTFSSPFSSNHYLFSQLLCPASATVPLTKSSLTVSPSISIPFFLNIPYLPFSFNICFSKMEL